MPSPLSLVPLAVIALLLNVVLWRLLLSGSPVIGNRLGTLAHVFRAPGVYLLRIGVVNRFLHQLLWVLPRAAWNDLFGVLIQPVPPSIGGIMIFGIRPFLLLPRHL